MSKTISSHTTLSATFIIKQALKVGKDKDRHLHYAEQVAGFIVDKDEKGYLSFRGRQVGCHSRIFLNISSFDLAGGGSIRSASVAIHTSL